MTTGEYEKYFVKKPIRELGRGVRGRHSPVMTCMSESLVPGCNKYLEYSWIWEMPDPNPHFVEHAIAYDKIVLFIGSDPEHFEDLGAEIEYYIGGQPLLFDTTAALYIPQGTSHGPVRWKKHERPHIEMSIILGPQSTRAGWLAEGAVPPPNPQKTTDIDYEKYIVRKPAFLQGTDVTEAIKSPAKIYMSSDLVPESRVYIDFGWIGNIPDPNPPIPDHCHDYEEVVVMIGNDPKHPEVLGAEIEFSFNDTPVAFNTSTAVFAPKGMRHGPLTWKKYERPHLLMPIIIGAGSLAEAAPAGYNPS